MSSAFVELLHKSNFDYIISKKSFKAVSQTENVIFVSLIDSKTKTLQLVACLDKQEPVVLWSTSLDERAFQLNARLLDLTELSATMTFLAECLNESDFTLAKAPSTKRVGEREISQINATFVHSKTKQSITLQLYEITNDTEKASLLNRIFLYVYKRNEHLSTELKAQQMRVKELSNKTEREQSHSSGNSGGFDGSKLIEGNSQKVNLMKSQERTKRSLVNPTSKRRKAATGITYGDDDSD